LIQAQQAMKSGGNILTQPVAVVATEAAMLHSKTGESKKIKWQQ